MLDRIRKLEENIAELERFRSSHTVEEVRRDRHLEWALRYGLFEAIQIVIDVCCHLVSEYNLGAPTTYSECVHFLRVGGYISPGLAEKLTAMIGLRNLLIHEYIRVVPEKLFGLLENVDDFKAFIAEIEEHLPKSDA